MTTIGSLAKRTTLGVCIALLAPLVDNRTAAACDACSCDTPQAIRPVVELSETVPLNAAFLVDLRDPETGKRQFDLNEVHWTNALTGGSISFETVDATSDHAVIWVVPLAPLEERTTYTISVGDLEDPVYRESFLTGAALDTSPPTPGTPRVEQGSRTAACGAFSGAQLVWSSIQDNNVNMDYEPVVELKITSDSDTASLFLDARNLLPGRAVQLAAPLDATSSECWGVAGLPFDASDSPLTVTATVYDRAGNHTELPPVLVTLSPQSAAECAATEKFQAACSLAPQASPQDKPGIILGLGLAAALGFWRRRTWTARRPVCGSKRH